MDWIGTELNRMTGGLVPDDDMITMRLDATVMFVDTKAEIVLGKRGLRVANKYAPGHRIRRRP